LPSWKKKTGKFSPLFWQSKKIRHEGETLARLDVIDNALFLVMLYSNLTTGKADLK